MAKGLSKRRNAKGAAASQPAKSAREPRGARRKRETREKLLRAAFELIAQRGEDAVAISEITDAADVGFGSFYNHFKSKAEIHDAVLLAVFDELGQSLEKLTAEIEDAAEVVAVRTRLALALAAKNPLWGRLLLREWYRPESFTLGMGPRLLRDIVAGIATQRFVVSDPLMALVMAGGTIVAAVALQSALRGPGAELVGKFGLSGADVERRAVVTLLRGLGMSAADADAIADKPLPAFDWKPSFAAQPETS